MNEQYIKFIRQKDYNLIREIGQGGTGRTVLIEDAQIQSQFVCKKYSPLREEYRIQFYKNFLEEIKILYQLNHPNIVRVFNYYLYPEMFTGYIIMEYIKGNNISDYLQRNPAWINNIFYQTIEGFRHLQQSGILHRDIRPENILVSEDNQSKIIDFGFGKTIRFQEDFGKSVSLNWRYSHPSEFVNKTYDYRTEVYFVGKMFEEIITESNLQGFNYWNQLRKMTMFNYSERIHNFFEVQKEIIQELNSTIDFSEEEKKTYQNFANELTWSISGISEGCSYIDDIPSIINQLEKVYKYSMLEKEIQKTPTVVNCFVKGNYSYSTLNLIKVNTVKTFINMLKSKTKDNQQIILNNLWNRLDGIPRYNPDKEYDNLPF